jgi:cytoskeletal protein CcmA (bactofilin family)
MGRSTPEPPLTVMGPGTHWDGDLTFEGRVRVDGHFEGRMYTEDVLEVGTEGHIEGELDVARAIVSGSVEGKLRVRDTLVVEPTGRIVGHLDAAVVEIRPGAFMDAVVRISGTTDEY